MSNNKKIAIVTGNYVGLGRSISEKLVEYGYQEPDVIRSKDFDLCKSTDCERLIDQVLDKYGRLDLLVNNVGNYVEKGVDDISHDEWHEMFDSNLHSSFYLTKKALPELRKTKGRILNIGYCGITKQSPPLDVVAYQAAKTALWVLTKGVAKQEAVNSVLVNMLSPGSLENTVEPPSIKAKIPLGELGSLEDAAETAMFLINSDYITGQNLEFAGGRAL